MIVSEKKAKINSPAMVAQVVRSLIQAENEESASQEHFYVIGLNNKNVIQYVDLCSLGTVSETIVHPREVFRLAIIRSCSSIIIAHNHPSGVLKPSSEDIKTTTRMGEAGELIGIRLLDHVIVTMDSLLSMKEENLMFSKNND